MRSVPVVGNIVRRYKTGESAIAARTFSPPFPEHPFEEDEARAEEACASSLYTLAIGDALDAHRLDYAVSRELGISRTYAQKLVRGGHVVSLDGRRIKPSIKVESGESYRIDVRSEEHTSELQSRINLVCRLLLEKKNLLLRS